MSLKEPRYPIGRRLHWHPMEMLFYYVTSLYFESLREDSLRSPGFSNDGKTAETQIIPGLLVCEHGYPLAYAISNGAQYESYTMIPAIDDFRQRFGIDDFIVVADSGSMISSNIDLLRSGKYGFIIRAMIRKKGKGLAGWLTSLPQRLSRNTGDYGWWRGLSVYQKAIWRPDRYSTLRKNG